MRPRTTAILGLIAVALGAFVYLYEINGSVEREDAAERSKRIFPNLSVEDLAQIRLLTVDGFETEINRSDQGWSLATPQPMVADQAAIDAFARALVLLERDGRIERPRNLAGFGFDHTGPSQTVSFTANGDDQSNAASRGLIIGGEAPMGGNTYVLLLDADRIDLVPTWRTRALQVELADLRDRRVIQFETASIQDVDLSWPGGGAKLEKREDGWWLVEPIEERADSETVETLLDDLALLRAAEFIDEAQDGDDLGLESPVFAVRLGGRTQAGEAVAVDLRVGNPVGDHRVVRALSGQLFEISPDRLDEWPRTIVAYRDKTVSEFDVAEAQTFELVFSHEEPDQLPVRIQAELTDGAWVSSPEPMDPEKAAVLVAELARLEGADILADELGERERAALGLRPPKVQIRVWGSGGGTAPDPLLAELSIGDVHPGLGIVAKRRGADLVYRLDGALVGEIPTSLSAYRKGFLSGD